MRRPSLFGTVLLVGFGVLIGAAAFGGADAIGGLVTAPLAVLGFMFQVLLFFLLFGLVMRLLVGGRRSPIGYWSGPARGRWPDGAVRHRHGWCGGGPRDDAATEPESDRFDEWHRMAHARKEVDDHTPPVED